MAFVVRTHTTSLPVFSRQADDWSNTRAPAGGPGTTATSRGENITTKGTDHK